MAQRSVYSTLFVSVEAIDLAAAYEVPAGYIAIVRDIAVFFVGSPEDSAVTVRGETGAGLIYYHLQTDAFEYDHWEGRQVVQPGSSITAVGEGPNEIAVRISGYLLVQ